MAIDDTSCSGVRGPWWSLADEEGREFQSKLERSAELPDSRPSSRLARVLDAGLGRSSGGSSSSIGQQSQPSPAQLSRWQAAPSGQHRLFKQPPATADHQQAPFETRDPYQESEFSLEPFSSQVTSDQKGTAGPLAEQGTWDGEAR